MGGCWVVLGWLRRKKVLELTGIVVVVVVVVCLKVRAIVARRARGRGRGKHVGPVAFVGRPTGWRSWIGRGGRIDRRETREHDVFEPGAAVGRAVGAGRG